jgi:hypothetical protein
MKRRHPSTDMAPAAVRLLARGGPCCRCSCSGCLAFHPPASPLALAGPNAGPSNSGKEQGLAQGRALAGQLGTCRYRPGPGPGRTLPLPLAHQGSSETPGRRALRWGPPSPRHRRRPLKAEIQQGACIWKSAAAAGEEAHGDRDTAKENRHTPVCLLDISYL